MTDPNFTLRPAGIDDIPTLLTLLRELAVYEKIEDSMVATEADYERHIFGKNPAAEALIAEIGSQPVGCAVFIEHFSTFAGRPGLYLEDVYIREEARGKGIGSAILQHLGKIALERNCTRFEWTVLDWNTSAIRFYENLGADILQDWRICRLNRSGIERLASHA